MHDPISCTSFSLLQSQSYLEAKASVFHQNACTLSSELLQGTTSPTGYSHYSLLWYAKVKIYLFLIKAQIMKMCVQS
jgi:hypothetical protein